MARIPLAHSLVLAQFCKLIYPAVALAGVCAVANKRTSVSIPGWLVSALALACVVPYHIGMARLRLWRTQLRAARLGATLPPQYSGKSIGKAQQIDV